MEKKWICYCRLFSAIFLMGIFSEAFAEEVINKVVQSEVTVPILNGDALAARDQGQQMAFEAALEKALPQDMPSDLRTKRVKQALRYVKSFRLVDEQQRGDSLQLIYEVEIQDSAFDYPRPAASSSTAAVVPSPAPMPSSPAQTPSMPEASVPAAPLMVGTPGAEGQPQAQPQPELQPVAEPTNLAIFEVLPKVPFNQAEVVDQVGAQLNLKVQSFRMTRTALILRIEKTKSEEEILQQLRGLVGSRGTVNLVQL